MPHRLQPRSPDRAPQKLTVKETTGAVRLEAPSPTVAQHVKPSAKVQFKIDISK